MSSTSASVQRADVYSRVTAEIIAAIEQGVGEWRAPWFHNGTSVARPTNISSGKRYCGVNTLALWAAGFAARYGDGLWGTYKQWQDAGAQVREGERSTTVVLWREIQSSRQADDEDDDDGHRRMFARAFSVFNVAQVDGYGHLARGTAAKSNIYGLKRCSPFSRQIIRLRTVRNLRGTIWQVSASSSVKRRQARRFTTIWSGAPGTSVIIPIAIANMSTGTICSLWSLSGAVSRSPAKP